MNRHAIAAKRAAAAAAELAEALAEMAEASGAPPEPSTRGPRRVRKDLIITETDVAVARAAIRRAGGTR